MKGDKGNIDPRAATEASDDPLAATATAGGGEEPATSPEGLGRGSALGRYTILQTLGEGGMGVVYGAFDPDLDRKVALKLLRVREGRGRGSAASARLLREARAMAKLSHPNVITVYEVGTASGIDFVAMEFVDGLDLGAWCHAEDRPWQRILRLFLQAGRGLAAAHQAGLIHRDFKPANVLVRQEETALVTDFGLARRVDEVVDLTTSFDHLRAVDDNQLTQTGAVLGTPAYMAPEQHRGGEADERSDQFSFCVALYEALYGERPFAGTTAQEILEAIDEGAVAAEPARSRVPAGLRRALLRGLAGDPAERYPSMDALLAALARSTAGRRTYLAALGLAAIGILAGGFAVAAADDGDPESALCEDADAKLRGVWTPERRAALEQAFAASGASFDGFARIVDGYVGDWRDAYQSACRATHVEGELPEADYLLTLECLLKRRDALEAMLDVFIGDGEGPGSAGLENAATAAASLPPILACADAGSLRSEIQPPEAAIRDQVEAIREDLKKVRTLGLALRVKDATALARGAVTRARELDYSPVLAEALVELGDALVDPKEAIEVLEEAILVAEESGYEAQRADALVKLYGVQSSVTSDYAQLEQLARRAESSVKRAGADEGLRGKLLGLRAAVDLRRRRFDLALETFREALAIHQRLYGPAGLKVASIHEGLAAALSQRGERSAAIEHARKAAAIVVDHHPQQHPKVILAREHLARILEMAGRTSEARTIYASTAPFWSSERGRALIAELLPDHRASPPMRVAAGRVQRADGKPVAGAVVVAGTMVVADGQVLDSRDSGLNEAKAYIRRTKTDPSGRFELEVPATEDIYIAAEHPDLGRSLPPKEAPLLSGKPGRSDLQLELLPYGRLEGVIAGSETVPGTIFVVGLTPRRNGPSGYPAAQVVAVDGEFTFERVPAGDYLLRLILASGTAADVESTEVDIRAGQTSRAELEASSIGQRVEVLVKLAGGGEVTSAQVFLMEGEFDIDSGGDDADAKILGHGKFRNAFTNRSEPAVFTAVPGGSYSVCVVPLGGDIADPDFVRALRDHRDEIPIHCQPLEVSAEDPTAVVVEVERAYRPPAERDDRSDGERSNRPGAN